MKVRKQHTLSVVTLAFCATLALVALGVSRLAKAQDAGTLNLVYVESNISSTGGNTVVGFSNTGGVLTKLGDFPTLGTGVVGGSGNAQLDADQQIVVNPEGTLLFAVNGNSNDISVFSIDAAGNLTLVGSPVPSGGSDPASVGLKDGVLGGGHSLLVAVNKASDPSQPPGTPNYTSFTVDSAGNMTEDSTFSIASGASPAQAVMSPLANQTTFFGIEFMNQEVVSYHLSKTGQITMLSSAKSPLTNPVVLGSAIDPKFKNTLFVSLPGNGRIAVFTYNAQGLLTYNSDFANPGVAVCWLAFNATGSVLYSSETGSGTITAYDVSNPSAPVQLQHLTLRDVIKGMHAQSENLTVDPTGNYLYVVDGGGALHVLTISPIGKLNEARLPVPLHLPAGTVPFGLAVVSK